MPKGWNIRIAPLPLRVALGVTFLWAGIGKIEATFGVKGEQAATLATMGVEKVRSAAPPGPTKPPETPAPTPPPTTPPPDPAQPGGPVITQPPPATPPTSPPDQQPQATPEHAPRAHAPAPFPTLAQVTAPSLSSGVGQPDPKRPYAANEFPDDIQVSRLYGLSLLIHKAAFPPPEAGATPMSLWPHRLARGAWPVWLAWSVAISEILAGLCVLIGLFTRPAGVVLIGVMLGAVWLTELGPSIQAGKTVLGFIPDRDPFAIEAWTRLLWQMALVLSSVTLVLLGGGSLSLDRKFFPPPPPPPPPGSVRPMV